jgi:hypothetical protein
VGGLVGTIKASNSLIGTTANDRVGDRLFALSNGNYVVASRFHDSSRGAATWGDGTVGIVGKINDANSLVGDTPLDHVGDRVTPLPNGNYVVASPDWDRGSIVDAGMATLGNGASGITGHVSADRSLVGSATGDGVGFAYALPDSSYFVSARRLNGAIPDAGSLTFAPPFGLTGEIRPGNTVLGRVTMSSLFPLSRHTADGSIVISGTPNVLILYHPNRVAPVFTPSPSDVAVKAAPGAGTTVVDYPLPTATVVDGGVRVECTPPSGTAFPIGATRVTCTAINDDGYSASASFNVIVTPADYLALAPARLADTRPGHTTVDGLYAGGGQVGAGSTLVLQVAGRGGVPIDSVAATLNVTVTEATAPGFLTAFPCGAPQPTASNLNYGVGTTIPNAVITKLGTNGNVCLFVQQAVHLVVDVNGAFPPSTTYVSINPARLLDTRPGQPTVDAMQSGGGATAAGSVTTLPLTGRAGIPADAAAAVLNVTVTEAAGPGFATVFPCGAEPPVASNLNYAQGSTIPNLVVSKLGASGAVCVFTQSSVHLVVDVLGYLPAGTSYHPLLPARLLDTRPGAPTVDGLLSGDGTRAVGTVTVVHVAGRGGVPGDAATAVLNVTVTEPVAAGFVTVYPCGIEPPLASNLNFVAGQTIPNAVLAKIGTNGDVCIFNSQPTHLIADVMGYYP